jgi:glycosyltransferase involved in cell wall biosynthesis
MHVWMLQTGESWPLTSGARRMRTGLLCDAMLQRGHSITWWTSGFEHQSKTMRSRDGGRWTDKRGVEIRALPALGYANNVSLRRYLDHLVVARSFRRRAAQLPPPDLLIASIPCPHLAAEGASFAAAHDIPLVVDLRDLWPDIFARVFPSWLAKLALAGEFRTLRRSLRRAGALLGISPGYVSLALERSGRERNRWDRHFYLGATRNAEGGALPECVRRFADRKLLVYVGTFGVSYELVLVVEAARRLADEGRNDFAVVLAGSGEQEGELQRLLEGHPAAVATGWLSKSGIGALLAHAHAGLAPFRHGAEQSVPNKAFDYFAAGLPIISSLEGEMEALIAEKGLGIAYRPGDCDLLVRAMRSMLDDPQGHARWSANAARFFDEEGDADRIYAGYCRHLEGFVAAGKGG